MQGNKVSATACLLIMNNIGQSSCMDAYVKSTLNNDACKKFVLLYYMNNEKVLHCRKCDMFLTVIKVK